MFTISIRPCLCAQNLSMARVGGLFADYMSTCCLWGRLLLTAVAACQLESILGVPPPTEVFYASKLSLAQQVKALPLCNCKCCVHVCARVYTRTYTCTCIYALDAYICALCNYLCLRAREYFIIKYIMHMYIYIIHIRLATFILPIL